MYALEKSFRMKQVSTWISKRRISSKRKSRQREKESDLLLFDVIIDKILKIKREKSKYFQWDAYIFRELIEPMNT